MRINTIKGFKSSDFAPSRQNMTNEIISGRESGVTSSTVFAIAESIRDEPARLESPSRVLIDCFLMFCPNIILKTFT